MVLFLKGTIEPHIAFGIDRAGFATAQTSLRELKIPFDREDHGPTESIYFRDPNGRKLEITTPK